MKQGWNILKLSDACTLTMGQSPISESYNTDGDGLPFFQGCSDFGKINPTIRTYCNAPTKIAEANDVLMSVRAPIGTLNIANVKCCIGRGLASFRATSRTTNSYLYYFLKHSRTKLESLGTGSTFKAIGKDALSKFPIPVPPIEEQKAICSLLDKLNQVIEAKKEQITELDKLAQSLFYSMFGDPITNENNFPIAKLGDVCENLHGIWKGKKTKLVNVGVIRNANFTKDFKLDYSKIEYIDVDADAFAKRYLQNGDLIVEKSGGTNKQPVGRAILYEGKNGVYSFSNFTMVLRIKHNDIINSKYLYYTLKLLYLMGITRQMQTQTTGLRNLILDRYLSLQISLPPMEEQKRFAEKIEKIEELKVKAKKQIEDIKEMLNYSMDKYFG